MAETTVKETDSFPTGIYEAVLNDAMKAWWSFSCSLPLNLEIPRKKIVDFWGRRMLMYFPTWEIPARRLCKLFATRLFSDALTGSIHFPQNWAGPGGRCPYFASRWWNGWKHLLRYYRQSLLFDSSDFYWNDGIISNCFALRNDVIINVRRAQIRLLVCVVFDLCTCFRDIFKSAVTNSSKLLHLPQ